MREIFFIFVRKFFLYLQENFDLDRSGKKALSKNVLCAFFISFCSYGSFLWLKKLLKIGANFCVSFL